jgi:hypothetical protein
MAHMAVDGSGIKYLNNPWHIEDVHEQAERDDVELTDEQCVRVLELCVQYHNAEVGINWDVISHHISTVLQEGNENGQGQHHTSEG